MKNIGHELSNEELSQVSGGGGIGGIQEAYKALRDFMDGFEEGYKEVRYFEDSGFTGDVNSAPTGIV